MYKMTPKLQKQYEDRIKTLQKKAFESGGGKSPAKMIENANENKDGLKDEYFQLLSVEIEKIKTLYNALSEDNYKNDLRKIYNLLHEIRGQAGTFDYILLSHVANEACILLTTLFKCGSQNFQTSKHLFGIFFRSLLLVYDKGPKACFGAEDKQLVMSLQKVRLKFEE